MGRFSCFYGHVPSLKQKKSAPPSFDTMIKTLQLGCQNHASTSTVDDLSLQKFRSLENGVNNLGNDSERGNFRKSHSVGSELDKQRTFSYENIDDYIVQKSSSEGSHETIEDISPTNNAQNHKNFVNDHDQEVSDSLSRHSSSLLVNHESVFAVDQQHDSNKVDQEDPHFSSYTECQDDSGRNTPTQSRISKCYSMPNFGSTSSKARVSPLNRTFEDLNILSNTKENVSTHDFNFNEISGQNESDNYVPYNYGSNKDWIIPMPDEIGETRHNEGDSYNNWDDFTNRDFKTKLIEDWVIELQHFNPVEEIHEVSDSSNDIKRDSSFLDGLDKVETRVNPGMESAKRYISSLNASASTAQLANNGLVTIPLLSAFVSLKVLNLSGNCIVRITAGALPRGLHVLNLSKNKISTIEGLRELTRLRVLDLSYNKISRIGHGLASCSTLKELYLAGNKISEVEGLHRLLKLTVIDLRFNKIATSKSLGQLAANYNSLQAISLEGNPAQKNVGDEQLKKYLQGLLPHLAYYNRQHIKSSTLKDSSDRSVRLGISDRALRFDHKSSSRRGSAALKRSSKGLASESVKSVKGKQVVVTLPSGAKMSNRYHQFEIGNKLESLKSGLSLHKSRSESTLAQV